MRAPLGLLLPVLISLAATSARGDDVAAGLAAIRASHTREVVEVLASDAFAGREAGRPGGRRAADWLAAQLADLGLAPAGDAGSYFEAFDDRGLRNVLGVLAGTDPAAGAIVVGAHYDHLGGADGIYNGADDNASGCAAVLEIARALRAAGLRPRRSIVFAFFDGEEHGKLGSKHYLSARPGHTVLMFNFDMVGRMWRRTVKVVGVGSSPRLAGWLDGAEPWVPRLRVKRYDSVSSSSDHAAFHAHGVPVLAANTGFHSDYHQPSDEAAKIDHQGIVWIAQLGFLLARRAADDPSDLAAEVDPTRASARAAAEALDMEPALGHGHGLVGGVSH